jgi:trk system potassium uptake protein TrkH
MEKEAKGFRLVFGYLGLFLFFVGLLNLLPLIMAAFYHDEIECYYAFLISGGSAILLGAILYFGLLFKRKVTRFKNNEASALLVLVWICAVFFGAMPFFVANCFGKMSMSFSESIFEATSAFTTTGLSVFKDFLDVPNAYCPHVFLFHRSLMQFVGGVGLVLIVSSLLSGGGSLKLYFAEGHNDKLLPSLGRSAKLIFGIYLGYTLLGTLAFYFGGMDLFDALNHSMCALSTAGFSTRSTGFAFYNTYSGNGVFPCNSLALEIIAMVLMLLGATNFVLHTFLLTGKFKKFFKDAEVRLVTLLLVMATFVAFLSGCLSMNGSFGENAPYALRYGIFTVVSSLTNTGFVNSSLDTFLTLGKPLVITSIILMAIGGGLGSTGGGIKQYRVYIDLKDLWWSIRYRFASPRTCNPRLVYRLGEETEVDEGTRTEAHNYSLLFILALLFGSMLICFLPDFNVETATYEFTSALSGTGLTLVDLVSYGKAHQNAYIILLWILSVGMFIGRLEILPVYYAIRNIFVDIKKKKTPSKSLED